MTSKAKKLLDEALELPTADREALAGQLFDSLESDDPGAEAAWEMEIEKRLNEIDQGNIKMMSWAEGGE